MLILFLVFTFFIVNYCGCNDFFFSQRYTGGATGRPISFSSFNDGDFLMLVWDVSGYNFASLARMSKEGNVKWIKDFKDSTASIFPLDVDVFENGNVVFIGWSSRGTPSATSWAVKTNSEGVILWDKKYTNDEIIFHESHIDPSDGDILVSGTYGTNDVLVAKLNSSSGAAIWSRKMDFDGGIEKSYDIVLSSFEENIAYICGNSLSFGGGEDVQYIIKFNTSNGDKIWGSAFGSSSFEELARGIVECDNGSAVAVTGYAERTSGYKDLVIVKLHQENGSVIWGKGITKTNKHIEGRDLVETSDGSFLVVGYIDVTSKGTESFIVKFTDSGGFVWAKIISFSTYDDRFSRIYNVPGNGVVAIGESYTGSVYEAFVVKLNESGISCDMEDIDVVYNDYTISNEWEIVSIFVDFTITPSDDVIVAQAYTNLDIWDKECWSCGGIFQTQDPCGEFGECNKTSLSCECESKEFILPYCTNTTCFNISTQNLEEVCGGTNRGECVSLDKCDCSNDYFGDECEWNYCFGIQSNESNSEKQCYGHGSCNFTDGICDCYNYSLYWGKDCGRFTCFGILNNEDSVCSSHGDCIDIDTCSCHSNYSLGEKNGSCNVWECFGKRNNDSLVCNSRGNCSSFNNCTCSKNYNGTECTSFFCNGIEKDTSEVCSSHGTCLSHDVCYCPNPIYGGKFCHEWGCYNESWLDINKVCFGHGICYAKDVCICQFGFESSTTKFGPCDYWYCDGKGKDLSGNVCSGRIGSKCETWSCGVDYKLDVTCNGNGKCISPKKCDCNFGFTGKFCDENLLYLTVMAPVLSLSGIGAIGFLLVVFGIICCLAGACGFLFVVFKQSSGLKKFRRLKNFELLLKEQQLDDDTSIAHLRINPKLFEIPFEEIKTECILGEGGSQSIVFKALWRGRTVAFKCFKTRTVCSDQEKFDEFEREVQILSSLSHPNVIRFFGATMNPPRVGIVMEFCSNGEFGDFIEEFRKKNGDGYPIEGKFRILHEVCSAMEYLHSRNIIHRDIKTENVLIDELEHAKLMDFGLSKLVDRMSVKKTKRVGTGIYMAPEVINEGNYTEKCDVFSMGIMMYIIITENIHPYGKNEFKLEFKVAGDPSYRPSLEELEKELSDDDEWIIDIIDKCWAHESEERYSFQELGELFKAESVMIGKKRTEMNTRSSLVVKSSGIGGKLKKKYETLQEAESELISLKGRLQTAMDGNEKLREDFEALEERMELMKEENGELKEGMELMKEENQKLKTEIEELKKKI